MKERIQKIKAMIDELNEWKLDNSLQQIPFNPPVNTQRIINTDMLVATGATADGFSVSYSIQLEVSMGGNKFLIPAQATI